MLIEFLLLILLLIALSFVWPPDSPWSPWWRTNKRTARTACLLAKVTKEDVVYELGSGDGEFILTAAAEFGCKKAIGIEIDYSRYLISKVRKKFLRTKSADFIRKDFKKVKLNSADVVYFYLVPRVINRIMPKLEKELKKGTRIISYKYRLPMKEKKRKGEIFLYQI